MTSAEAAIERTLAFHEAWSHVPTDAELVLTLDVANDHDVRREEVVNAIRRRNRKTSVNEKNIFQPRKRRAALRVARWLARLSGVRFVALANTTALADAGDESDLDFFVIVRKGTIWSTRLLGGGPFKLMGKMPTADNSRDAVCLSYFIADDALDLSSHALADDPYFRQWFLALLPLYDDGVSQQLWDANAALRSRHPFAEKWVVPPDLEIACPSLRIPTGPIESIAKAFQYNWFPKEIRERMNKDTTVIVNDSTLKFHVTDGRETYRAKYQDLCRQRGVSA